MVQTKVSSTKEINGVLREQVKTKRRVRIGGLKGHHSIATGIDADVEISVGGDAGDFFAAFNNGPTVLLKGSAGSFLGDSMEGGEVILLGSAGDGVGQGMRGGTLVVKGEAASRVGYLARGGTIIIDGKAGELVGNLMSGGTIVVTGDAGPDVGAGMTGGVVYVGGEIESVGKGAKLASLEDEDKERLMDVRQSYGVKKKLLVFEKVIPAKEEADAPAGLE